MDAKGHKAAIEAAVAAAEADGYTLYITDGDIREAHLAWGEWPRNVKWIELDL